MNISTRLKFLLANALATAGLAAVAAPTVSVDEVTNGDPWSTITVKYTLDGVETQYKHKVAFDVTAKDVTKGVTNAAADLTSGAYERVIDTAELFGEAKTDPQAKVRVSLIAVKPLPPPENTYMIINLTADGNGKYLVTYEDIDDQSVANAKFNTDTYKTDYLVLRKVKAGKSYYFKPYGSSETFSTLTDADKLPVNRDYWISLFEVTEAQYAKVMGTTATTSILPQTNLSYINIRGTDDATSNPADTSFLGLLTTRCQDADGKPVTDFDLPTEAQWEIACRAGTTTKYYWGDSFSSDYAVRGGSVLNVGSKQPNAWGIYDMSGNAQEWVRDAFTYFEGYQGARAKNSAEEYQTPVPSVGNARKYFRGGCYGYTDSGLDNYFGSSFRSRERNENTGDYGSGGLRLCHMAPAQ